jgi:hypothetical protein
MYAIYSIAIQTVDDDCDIVRYRAHKVGDGLRYSARPT